MSRRRIRATLLALTVITAVSMAYGWNPVFTIGGAPARWDSASAVTWNPDGGSLGKLSNVQAVTMVDDSFDVWQNVATAVISYAQGGQIVDGGGSPVDVTSANYSAIIGLSNGQNPIMFDNDRDIFNALGVPSSVLGFAGVLSSSGTTVTKGYAVLQGDWYDDEPSGTAPSDPGETSEDGFRSMMVHEFGHFSGIAHTSVNHELAGGLPGCAAPTAAQIETMSPFLNSSQRVLHNDDEIAISVLYPTAAFGSTLTKIQGELIDRDGVTPFPGGNVVVRPDTADCNALYDQAQAQISGAVPSEAGGGDGAYGFPGLSPSSSWTVFVTTISDGGSYPGPAPSLGAPDEYYNGASEDSFDPPDSPPSVYAVTTGAAGSTTAGIDIRLNNAGDPGEVLESLLLTGFDGQAPGGPPVDRALEDLSPISSSGYGGTAQAAWINRFSPAASELPLRIERIDILFWSGSLAPGRAIRLLVYHDAAATGNPANAALVYSEDVTIQALSTSAFNEYTLASPVTITSGEFYVGAYDLEADAASSFVMSYDADAAAGPSYLQANSTSPAGYALFGGGVFHVRTRTQFLPPAGSVLLEWSPACNDGTVPGQDYGVYEGSLASLPGSGDHAPIICTTGALTSYTVLGSGDDRYWLIAPIMATKEGSLGTGSGMSARPPLSTCQAVDPAACP